MPIIDTTDGSLVRKVISLAVPSILQTILSNCYALNDFLFVARIKDEQLASLCTAAISATVGMQFVLFAFHNIIPSGSNAYSSQYAGASNTAGLQSTFRAGFYASLIISILVGLVGWLFIDQIAHLTNSPPDVTKQIATFFAILVLASPAFGFMLLVDGFYRSNGDATTPLVLEICSLILNSICNYLFILEFNWGIAGAGFATALSRLLPALVGGYRLIQGKVGFPVSLRIRTWQDVREVWTVSKNLASIGVFESGSELIYGIVFTVLIRLTGDLGPAQQAGLGAGMRGLEWISFTISEGFLMAAMTSVGQNIGAKLHDRAMKAAWICCVLSAAGAGIFGVLFLSMPMTIAKILSNDVDIIKYCSIYLRACGCIMALVGFEMACYGTFLGAGKARTVFLTSATMNLLRIPLTILGLYGTADFWLNLAWSFGFVSGDINADTGAIIHGGRVVDMVGKFDIVCWAIVATCVVKSLIYGCMLGYRQYSGLLFSDCTLTDEHGVSADTVKPEESGPGDINATEAPEEWVFSDNPLIKAKTVTSLSGGTRSVQCSQDDARAVEMSTLRIDKSHHSQRAE